MSQRLHRQLHRVRTITALAALTSLCACGDEAPPTQAGAPGWEERGWRSERPGFNMNVLWVVDTSLLGDANKPLQEKLLQLAAGFPTDRLLRASHAVVVSGGAVPPSKRPAESTCPPRGTTWDFNQVCEEPKETTSLSDHLSCALAFQTAAVTHEPPLAALERILQNPPQTGSGRPFHEPSSFLHIVIVSGVDDAGALPVSRTLAAAFAARQPLGERLIATVIAPKSAARLNEFAAAFGEQGMFVDVAAPSWALSNAFDWISGGTCLAGHTLEALQATGRGGECVVEEWSPISEGVYRKRVLPACEAGGGVPCWTLDVTGCADIIITRGGCLPTEGTVIATACAGPLPRRHETFGEN